MMDRIAFLLWQQQGGGGSYMLMMVVFFAVMFFLLIMPQQRRQKKWQEMLAGLKAGDRVTTNGGIVGIIVSIKQGEGSDPGSIILRVNPDNLKIEVARNAIASVTVDDSAKKS
ncbi:MAG: preprotein translocase subunit YajC [Acidobacteriota bacterium]|nr:preprotein translocase subunit YajC [Acidobacteriota bacterium]